MTPLARYRVRAPLAYWVVFGVLLGLAAAMLAPLAWFFSRFHRVMWDPWLVGVAIGVLALPWIYLAGTRQHRARGEILLYADRLELPGPGASSFPLDGLHVSKTPVRVRYMLYGILPVATVNHGNMVRFEHGATWRELSDRVFDDPRFLDALLEDIARVRGGGIAEGPRVVAAPRPAPRTPDEYERQLDRELDELDD